VNNDSLLKVFHVAAVVLSGVSSEALGVRTSAGEAETAQSPGSGTDTGKGGRRKHICASG